ncbi:MAG: hypothetical protein IKY16_01930 [Bacteroidales bacterium]|jgi:hypothetical protein|nr:hypothetical protein [Bacteroidales bacterium]
MIRKIEKLFILTVFLVISVCVHAQDGTYGAYSPYSIYGIGDIAKEGTAYNKSMGGTGIATRNRRFINYMNPAAVTARDTLSFMADFGLVQKNTLYRQGDLRSANNTFNIYDFIMSFPIYRSSAFMVGLTPYSDVGYDFSSIETNPDIIGNTGNITYDSYGNGSVYQAFVGAGVTFWKKLSLGAEVIYYFGNIDKVTNMNYADDSYRSLNSGSELMVRGTTGKFGLQYEQKLGGDVSMIIGATYKMGTSMKGYATNFRYANQSSVTDSLKHTVDTLGASGLRFADEIGLGISVKGGEKWSAEFNYTRSDWSRSGFDAIKGFAVSGNSLFSSTVSQSFRAGFEFVPNRNDIRYYMRRCAYRFGAYYDQAYYKLDGNNVNSMGITFGITLPVFQWYNGVSLGVDLGQRSSTRNNMIRERYATFVIGFNIHDIWFRKPQYN